MDTFFQSILSVFVILLLTATGYFCGVRQWINEESKRFISRFLMNLAIPCMCIHGLTTNLAPTIYLPMFLEDFSSSPGSGWGFL